MADLSGELPVASNCSSTFCDITFDTFDITFETFDTFDVTFETTFDITFDTS